MRLYLATLWAAFRGKRVTSLRFGESVFIDTGERLIFKGRIVDLTVSSTFNQPSRLTLTATTEDANLVRVL